MNLEPHPHIDGLYIVKYDKELSSRFDLESYFLKNSDFINEGVKKGMSFYFKGFPVETVKECEELISKINPNFIPYTGAKVRLESQSSEVFYKPTSTPRNRKNFLHNEMAYQPEIPPIITIFCEKPGIGGESLIGDQRKVWLSIKKEYREKIISKKLKFIRSLINQSWVHNYLSTNFDFMATYPSWQNNFKTDKKDVVEDLLKKKGFELEWSRNDDLSFSCIIDPCKEHPKTKELMWVNNSHLFQLHPKVYGSFLFNIFSFYFKLSKRTMTTCLYGDGSPIESEVITNILEATELNEIPISLNAGDFIYANNWTCSHGRKTFKGHRELFFALLNNS